MIAGTPWRASAQPSWRCDHDVGLMGACQSAGPWRSRSIRPVRRVPGLPRFRMRDRLAGGRDGDRIEIDRGGDRGERHDRMGGEIFGAEQAFLLRGRRQDEDVAGGPRRRGEAAGDLDHHRDAAGIVDRAVADPVRGAFGPADAEMVPMGEKQHVLAGRAGAANPADDVVGRVVANVGRRHEGCPGAARSRRGRRSRADR